MKRRCAVGMALWLALSFSSASLAQKAPDGLRIRDAGQERDFEVALDEVYRAGKDGRGREARMPALESREAVRRHAEALERTSGEEVNLVLYEKGAERTPYTRRVVTRKVLVHLEENTDPLALARSVNATFGGPAPAAPGFFVFEVRGPGQALDVAELLRGQPGVISAEPLLARQQKKKSDASPRPPEFKSIHQLELEEHRQVPEEEAPVPFRPARAPLAARAATAPTLTHKVFGWYPSWKGTHYTNLNFNLLSTIGYFAYEVNSTNGSYDSVGSWTTTGLIPLAQSNGVKVVLTATLFGNSNVKRLLTNSTACANFINTIVGVVSNRGGQGVCVDFESISESALRAPLTALLSNLAVRVRRDLPGAEVSVALPAVDWAGAFDVAAYNGFLDYACIMGYDYYWSTAPNAGPVSPLRASTLFGAWCIERSINDYLAAGIQPAKLMVGLPLYGYEWPTTSLALKAPTTGSGTARIYPTAVDRAATYGRRWDTNSLTPYFFTGTTGAYTQCWYDDTNSLALKCDMIKSKGIGGVGLWALGYEGTRPDIWNLLTASFVSTNVPYPNDTLFSLQWHLCNTGQNGGVKGVDVNVTNVWRTYRGNGLMIAITDDGLQTGHTDLWENVNTAIDIDFNGGDRDPNPNLTQDFHGTACAGVAAARGNNGRGVCGAAPEATLVGVRLIGGAATDADEANAMLHSNQLIFVNSNSWGPDDDGKTLAGPGPLTAAALRNGALNGRGGKGTLFLWACGNGADNQDDSNKDGYANSIYTIAIGALSDQGTKASYSEPGANVVVTAPSSSFNPDRQGITTTDLMGNNGYNAAGVTGELTDRNYTKTFGGTSSATPLAAGIMALVLEAAPNIGWRDAQEILIRSARKNDPTDADWITNGAGFRFNHKYGAGLIDAQAAVNLAKTWTNLGPQITVGQFQTNLAVAIPDNVATGIVRTFTFSGTALRVEHVTLAVDITHANRGDLAIQLVSPAGTTSRLAEVHGDTGDHYRYWTFSSVRHWGESANGTWTVRIADRRSSNAGTLGYLRLDLYGTSTGANSAPVWNPIGNRTVLLSNSLSFAVSATDPDGDPVTLTASNRPSGSTFTSTGGTGTFTWASATPVGVYTTRFNAADNKGASAVETVLITVSNPPSGGALPNLWINEIHYDNASTDVGEGVEIAGPAGTDLSAFSLLFYDGGGGAVYKTVALSGVIDHESNGYGALWFDAAGMQNGAPDGVALVRGTQVVQFISYEGSFTAASGAAAGMTAPDIGVKEAGTEPAGQSLQLKGTGTNYAQFAWSPPSSGSPGSLNAGQTIGTPSAGVPPKLATIGDKSVVLSNTLQFAVTATDANGDAITLSASNRPSGSVFSSTGGVGTFTWTNAKPVGVYTTTFYAVDKDGMDAQAVKLTVTAPATGAAAAVWINELHYDNNGTDVNEGVEVAGVAGTPLSGWSLVSYNGGDGLAYKTVNLSGTIDEEGCGYGAVWFAAAGLQNGAPDGVALVQGAAVVQFLSYEGAFTAAGGPAAGRTSTDIGVMEVGTETGDISLQLKGSGNGYAQFTWSAPSTASRGSLNAGQSIVPCGGGGGTPPTVRFLASEYVVGEEQGTLAVPVALSFPANLTVNFSIGGAATRGSGADYTLSATALVFSAAGPTQQTITVSLNDDTVEEPIETIVLTLTNLANAVTGTPRQVTIHVRDNETFTLMAANLASQPTACGSEYHDPAQRIFRGLKPDIVAIQEFVVTNAGGYAEFVRNNFGTNFQYFVESQTGSSCDIPNGIISRWPILAAGEWSGPYVGYRDFAWATIDVPGPRNLHVISVHLDFSDPPDRPSEARALTNYIRLANFPTSDYVAICGDLNTTNREELALRILTNIVSDARQPADQNGNKNTNSDRNKPYDYVLPGRNLDALHLPVIVGTNAFAEGLVFDSRLWTAPPAPILTADSGSDNIQHMAVMKRFRIPAAAPTGHPWINEFHYDNTGTDTDEGVEIAGPAGTDLSAYRLWFYRGDYGTVYGTNTLSGIIDHEMNGYGAVWFAQAPIQNGPDAIALEHIPTTNVLLFISYEGIVTGKAGVANGMISTDIGVFENASPLGYSLQLRGAGNKYSDFTWVGPTNGSPGSLNAGQTISMGLLGVRLNGSPPTLQPIGNKVVKLGEDLLFGVSATPTDGDPVDLVASNLPAGATFNANEGSGQFQWFGCEPLGVYTCSFHAVDKDGADFEIITITVTDLDLPADALLYYDFGEDAESYTNAPRMIAPNLGVSNLDTAHGEPDRADGNPGNAASKTGWTSGNYYEFSVTVAGGFELVPLRLLFDDRRAAGGPTVWGLRYSGDGFGSDLASDSTHSSFQANAAALSDLILTGTTTFRIFGRNATLNVGWRLDNLLLRGLVLPAGQNSDGDRMPDAWEIATFGDLDTADDTTDYDEDGSSDADEWAAGTRARDETSLLRLESSALDGNGQRLLRWSSVSNRVYRVERSTNLMIGFDLLQGGIPASPPVNVHTDAPPTPPLTIYRVLVE